MQPLILRSLNPRVIALTSFVLLAVSADCALAVVRTWDPVGASFDWHSANNWDPTGVPTFSDDVDFTGGLILLTADTARVKSLDLTGGATLLTNGHTLNVDLFGSRLLRVDGGGTTFPRVTVFPTLGSFTNRGLRAGNIQIAAGGAIDVRDPSAVILVEEVLAILPGGALFGSGNGSKVIILEGFGTVLINDGVINADGGSTQIRAFFFSDRKLDLDGSNENGVVNVSAGATLLVSGELADGFNGTINIGSGARLRMDAPWVNSTTAFGINPGIVELDNGELDGQPVTNFGIIRGHGSITSSSIVNQNQIIAENGTLVIDGFDDALDIDGTSGEGSATVSGGATLRNLDPLTDSFNGVITIGDGGALAVLDMALPWTISGAGDPGQVALANGELAGAMVINDGNTAGYGTISADFVHNGALVGQGPNLADALTFTGNLTGSAPLQGNIVIAGNYMPGNSTAAVDGENLEITAAGMLSIEVGGLDPGTEHDQVNLTGDATLAGTLDVEFLSGYLPDLGDTFTILTAGDVIGEFDARNLPVFDGRTLDVIYNSQSVVLQVIGELLLAGDFDGDGDVDGGDFLKWQRGEVSDPPSASDLDDWEANYGMTAPLTTSSRAVPEPTSCVLLLVAAVVTCLRSRNASRKAVPPRPSASPRPLRFKTVR